jgi:hypothetical protein
MLAARKVKTRAQSLPGTDVGRLRYSLYRQAYARISEASKKGFISRAIAIIESLITDRLESRLTFLMDRDVSFKTLGNLIAEIRKMEMDETFKQLVSNDVDRWRASRNIAIHEMAKIADGEFLTWESRAKAIEAVAASGLTCLRAIDRRFKTLRKSGK